jgi:hypothetical protein
VEEIQEINPKKHFMNLPAKIKSLKSINDHSISEEEFLLQCEVMMRKALDQLDTEKQLYLI